jgi:predicted amidophosphoribosyltransferase
VWSSAWYAGAVRRAIVQWKRHGRAELDVEMTRAVGRVAEHIARDLALVLRVLGEDGLVVAPIPSRASTRAARGTLGTELLAGAVAGALAGAGIAARPLACLARRASATDQAGLSLRARAANREGATRLRVVPDAPVVLVDDVLTTGATLLDAERALARAGARTLGAVALAATPSGSWNR